MEITVNRGASWIARLRAAAPAPTTGRSKSSRRPSTPGSAKQLTTMASYSRGIASRLASAQSYSAAAAYSSSNMVSMDIGPLVKLMASASIPGGRTSRQQRPAASFKILDVYKRQ